jgi:RNA polymerase Rpb1, domain 7
LIADAFSTDLFVIWSEDNSDKLIIRCRSLTPKNEKDDEEEIQIEEDQFLRQIENTMLNNITLRGVEGIRRVFMMERPKPTLTKAGVFAGKGDSELEWTLETDGINAKVMGIDGVDFKRTYSNSCRISSKRWALGLHVLPHSQSFKFSSSSTFPTWLREIPALGSAVRPYDKPRNSDALFKIAKYNMSRFSEKENIDLQMAQ